MKRLIRARAAVGPEWTCLTRAAGSLLAAAALAACSSENVYILGLPGDDAAVDAQVPHPAQAYVAATIGPSSSFPSEPCPFGAATTAFEVGTEATSVPTGTGGTIVTCSVRADGGHFAVEGNVTSSDGAFTLSGAITTRGAQGGVATSMRLSGGDYSDANCSVTLVPTMGPSIDRGRVWGTVTCEDMTLASEPGRVCAASIVFRLENCGGSP